MRLDLTELDIGTLRIAPKARLDAASATKTGCRDIASRWATTRGASAYSRVYEGTLDAAVQTLTRETEGRGFAKGGRAVRFRDVIVFRGEAARTVASRPKEEDGRWTGVVAMRCPRAG